MYSTSWSRCHVLALQELTSLLLPKTVDESGATTSSLLTSCYRGVGTERAATPPLTLTLRIRMVLASKPRHTFKDALLQPALALHLVRCTPPLALQLRTRLGLAPRSRQALARCTPHLTWLRAHGRHYKSTADAGASYSTTSANAQPWLTLAQRAPPLTQARRTQLELMPRMLHPALT